MARPAISCTVRFANDSQGAWATRADSGYANIIFWLNPQSEMTMADAISTIERDLGPMYVGLVLVRGQHIPRAQLRNYKATDLLRNNEAFNMYLAAKCTIL